VCVRRINNMELKSGANDWAVSTIFWYAIFVWFGASLFSQIGYLAINGEPYDAKELLYSAGSYAWIIIAIELIIWASIFFHIVIKLFKRFRINTLENLSSEVIAPHP